MRVLDMHAGRRLLMAALCAMAVETQAQPAPPANDRKSSAAADAATAPPALNGYGENLKSTRPRAAATWKNGPGPNRPYEPIRKVDDEGQIPEIEMFVGESRVFATPGVARIAVGNGTLLSAAALDDKEVIVFANGVGTSSLFIWNADGRYQRVKVSIVPGDTTRNAREIAAFLSAIPKAKASIVGANIVVEGDELADVDLAKIDELTKRYPQIINFTNRVGWEQMVLMDVRVVEFPTTFLRDLGLSWNATGGGAIGAIWSPIRRQTTGPYQIAIQTGSTGVAPPITGVDGGAPIIPSSLNVLSVLNLGLNAQLLALQQEGKATTLAQPQLSARNGSKASFTAGGEIPYAVETRDGLAVAFKEYGVKLDITPRVDHGGAIRAVIHAEVSSIDPSVSTPVGPALLLRKTDTEFNLRAGETMVLAGLLQRDTSTSIDKVPYLGDLPVLGALFRSKHYTNKETEMVVFVTPTLVTAASAGNIDRIDRTNQRLKEEMGPSPYLSEPVQPGVHYERPDVIPPRPVLPPDETIGMRPSEPAPIGAMPFAALPRVASAGPAAASASAPTSSADRGSALTVLADGVVLRADANNDATSLLRLDRGAIVQLGAAEPRSGSSLVWRNVVVGSLDGWVPANAVSPAKGQVTLVPGKSADPGTRQRQVRRPLDAASGPSVAKPLTLDGPAPQARTFKVTTGGLAIRITPDVNGEVVTRSTRGDTVVALPYPSRGGWTAVQLGDGDAARRGWIASQWLMPVTP